MKERPILFSAPMVRAILAGTKTQTRRVVKPAPQTVRNHRSAAWDGDPAELMKLLTTAGRRCPYGQPGDRLWVREAWKAHTTFDHLPPRDIPESHVWYMADDGYKAESRYRQGMFMPRWASRITLEVTGVRVEGLQDISEADAKAEGIKPHEVRQFWLFGADEERRAAIYRQAAVTPYRDLWEQINGPESWSANPWVWVVEFKRLEAASSTEAQAMRAAA